MHIDNFFFSYLEHGADIITTASYQASIPGFQKHLGITEEKSQDLIKLSVELAKKARADYSAVTKSMFCNLIFKMCLNSLYDYI